MASEPDTGAAPRAQPDRKLPLALHRPLEMGLGVILAVVPLVGATTGVVQMPTIGVVLCILVGAGLMTLGLAGRREQEGVSASAHRVADFIVVGILVVAGLLFIFALTLPTGLFLLRFGIAHGVLSLGTRYARDEIRRHSTPDDPPQRREKQEAESG